MEPTPAPSYELYSPGQIATASFFGAPVAACWFLSRNCRALGQPRQAIQCLVCGVVGTALLLALAFVLPERVPSQAIPIAYTIGTYQAAEHLHGQLVREHLSRGGRLGSWWAVAGVGLLCLTVIVAIIVGIVFILPED